MVARADIVSQAHQAETIAAPEDNLLADILGEIIFEDEASCGLRMPQCRLLAATWSSVGWHGRPTDEPTKERMI